MWKVRLQVQSVMKKMAAIDVQTICPLHGPVLKGEALAEAVKLYDTWSKVRAGKRGNTDCICQHSWWNSRSS